MNRIQRTTNAQPKKIKQCLQCIFVITMFDLIIVIVVAAIIVFKTAATTIVCIKIIRIKLKCMLNCLNFDTNNHCTCNVPCYLGNKPIKNKNKPKKNIYNPLFVI